MKNHLGYFEIACIIERGILHPTAVSPPGANELAPYALLPAKPSSFFGWVWRARGTSSTQILL